MIKFLRGTTALIAMLLLTDIASAETIGQLREKCVIADRYISSPEELTSGEEKDALACIYTIRGAIAQQRAGCLYSKLAVSSSIEKDDFWGETGTLAQFGAWQLESTVDVSVSDFIAELIAVTDKSPERWGQPSFYALYELKFSYFEANPSKKCDSFSLIRQKTDEMIDD